MPILLDDIEAAAKLKVYSPMFFNKKLTGRGGTAPGLLQDHRNPSHLTETPKLTDELRECRAFHYQSDGTTYNFIPLYTTPVEMWSWPYLPEIDLPQFTNDKPLATKGDWELHCRIDVHAMVLTEYRANDITKRDLEVSYDVFGFVVNKNNAKDKAAAANLYTANTTGLGWWGAPKRNGFYHALTTNPKETLEKLLRNADKAGWDIHSQNFLAAITDFDLYTNLCERAEFWQTRIADDIELMCAAASARFTKYGAANGTQNITQNNTIHAVIKQLRLIESYNVPLEHYKAIYDAITKHFAPDVAERICKENLSLLLSDTLHKLDADKPNLACLPKSSSAVCDPFFSIEQKAAIQSTNPLILVQSGAGSGKSTVISGRIKYMIDSGINPEDITVLSFTNAAADHITEICPDIHSMTIASMVHQIYEANFKNHQLSSIDTLINSLSIMYGDHDADAKEFRRMLLNMKKNQAGGVTAMNNYIEENFKLVRRMLNTIGQTCLELEIIICYQCIENLVEPPEISSKFLIIDEVQDNSVFEFIYALKYVAKHKESLFLVGRHCSR